MIKIGMLRETRVPESIRKLKKIRYSLFGIYSFKNNMYKLFFLFILLLFLYN